MIKSKEFLNTLQKSKINFFTGVPDSLFSSLCSKLEKNSQHHPAPNEGSAIGLAIGYHLSTNKLPLVYLQNSGLGNIVNPIASLTNKKIFNIPLFLIIGWRGEMKKKIQVKDEPQHVFQGRITEELLKILQIKYKILDDRTNFKKDVRELANFSLKNSKPVAFLVRRNTFYKEKKKIKIDKKSLTREIVLQTIVKLIPKNSPIVSTTGVLSRELMEINNSLNKKNSFYCVGGMGHAISIANGIALKKKKKKVFCFDGDGAALMHLGALVNSSQANNLVHILINNKSHDSVGAQKTASNKILFYKIAYHLGYKKTFRCKNKSQITKALKLATKNNSSTFVEVLCRPGFRPDLTRPQKKMTFYKKEFMKHLKK